MVGNVKKNSLILEEKITYHLKVSLVTFKTRYYQTLFKRNVPGYGTKIRFRTLTLSSLLIGTVQLTDPWHVLQRDTY
jgi:hypothetical protein